MAKNGAGSGDYEVGYGRTPKHTRFKPGQSGNPRGKPRGAKSVKAILRKEGRQRVRITENGKSVSITKLELAIKRLYERAARGDLKAISELVALHRHYGLDDEVVRALTLSADEEAILADLAARRSRLRDGPSAAAEPSGEQSDG